MEPGRRNSLGGQEVWIIKVAVEMAYKKHSEEEVA
ncbi:MAG: hypothetical protein ACFFCD_09975 [Promethearchaeota archaeon]